MTLTKNDKVYIENILDKGLSKQESRFEGALLKQESKFENKLDEIEQKFEAKLTEFRDDFHTKIDPILKEVVASREDRAIGAEQHRRNEERIEKLEKIHPQGKHSSAIA